MTSNRNLFRHLPWAIFVTLLTACGSSGGNKSSTPPSSSSSSSSSGSTKPTPTVNAVKIKIAGLDGTLELVNGTDPLVVKANGDTQFARTVEVGVSYNVRITKQPENQICSVVKNGHKVMAATNLPVEIACSNGFGVGLDIAKPKDFSLKNLQVVSNYQHLGGANDPALTIDSTIKTRQNSFIALKNASEERTYFVGYVDSQTQTRIKLDADNTALALLIMEPSITGVLTTHNLTVTNLYNLIAPVNAQNVRQLDGDLKKLSDEIARQADKNVDLFSAQSNIGALLEKALTSIIDKIASQPMATETVSEPTPVADLGVDFKVVPLSATKIALTVNNQRQRTVSISGLSDHKTPTLLDGHNAITLEQTVEAGKFYKLNINVNGPGKLGNLKATDTEFKAAFVRSSLADYFMPNIAYFSGSQVLSAQLAMDCMSDDNLEDLTDVGDAVWSLVQSPLEQDLYYKAYHAMAEKYRAYWLDGAHMDDLLTCSSLGLAGLAANEKLIAKSHLISLLAGFNKLRDPASVKEDLFRTEKQSALVSALFKSAAQGLWSTTNAFTLDIKAPKSIDDETNAEFAARCLDEAKKEVACSLSWTLEDATLTGSTVQYQFKKATARIVNLVASNASGAQVSQAIDINVIRKSAGIWLSIKGSSVVLDRSKPLDFDNVFVGTQLPQSLVIKNSGNLPLVISSISLDGAAFTTTLKEATVNVGSELVFPVEFNPAVAQAYTGVLSFQTNDKSNTQVQIHLAGLGTPAVAAGKYEIIENGETQEKIVAQTNETAISGDESFSQVDLFGQSTGLFPRISLKLNKFTGPGSYSLDDIYVDKDDLPETCLALYAAVKDDFTQQYCTGTHSGKTYSGSLVVTEISVDMYKLDYDFSAVNCTNSTGGAICVEKVIQLRGTTNVKKAVLMPPEITTP